MSIKFYKNKVSLQATHLQTKLDVKSYRGKY